MQYNYDKTDFSSLDEVFRWFLLGGLLADRQTLQKKLEKIEEVVEYIEKTEGEIDIEALAQFGLWDKVELRSFWDYADIAYVFTRSDRESRSKRTKPNEARGLRLVHST